MLAQKRSGIDRRTGDDRRKVYNIDYFLEGGLERRSWEERRGSGERRKGWVRVTKWSSVDMEVCSTGVTPYHLDIG